MIGAYHRFSMYILASCLSIQDSVAAMFNFQLVSAMRCRMRTILRRRRSKIVKIVALRLRGCTVPVWTSVEQV